MQHIGCNLLCPQGIDPTDSGANTRSATLRFRRDQLLYDLRNMAYVEGHVMGEERQHAQHTLVDIGEEGNVDRVTRILGAVHAAVVEMLYPYTKRELPADTAEDVGNELWEPQEYVIELTLPAGFSLTTLHLLSKLIHEYMVCRVLYDWLSITNPEASQVWLAKAMEAEEEINSVKNARTGTLRRPAHPF